MVLIYWKRLNIEKLKFEKGVKEIFMESYKSVSLNKNEVKIYIVFKNNWNKNLFF